MCTGPALSVARAVSMTSTVAPSTRVLTGSPSGGRGVPSP
jgi:hypothetical protein